MAYLNLRTKHRVLTGRVLRAAQRVFGIPEFRFYALADGIKAYLFAEKRGVYGCFSFRHPETGRQSLFFALIFGGTFPEGFVDFMLHLVLYNTSLRKRKVK